MFRLDGHPDGARSADGRIEGTYLHGAFVQDGFRRSWLSRDGALPDATLSYTMEVDRALDALASEVEAAVDIDALFATAERPGWSPASR
jgi:adenosylcobyric acid synthase